MRVNGDIMPQMSRTARLTEFKIPGAGTAKIIYNAIRTSFTNLDESVEIAHAQEGRLISYRELLIGRKENPKLFRNLGGHGFWLNDTGTDLSGICRADFKQFDFTQMPSKTKWGVLPFDQKAVATKRTGPLSVEIVARYGLGRGIEADACLFIGDAEAYEKFDLVVYVVDDRHVADSHPVPDGQDKGGPALAALGTALSKLAREDLEASRKLLRQTKRK